MASNAIGGIAFIKVDGTQYQLRGNFKVAPGNVERTEVVGGDGTLHGYTQAGKAPYIAGDLSDSGGLSVQALQNITNSTITLELINGKTYILTNAFHAPQNELDVMTATLSVKFFGKTCQELVAS